MRRIALFFVINTLSYGFAVESPQNTFAVVGQTAFLKCRPTPGFKVRDWWFKGSNVNVSFIITRGTNIQPTRRIVDNDQNGYSVLSINDIMMEDGGNYACRLENDRTAAIATIYDAELIALDRNSQQCELKTSDNTISGGIKEGNYLDILCNFSFTGNMVPVIKWFRNSQRISLPLHPTDYYVDGIHSFHFTTTLQLNAGDNGTVFSCEVDFERSNSAESAQTSVIRATNALSNVFRWNFTAVVWYMPRNIRFKSKKTIYNFGDHVECLADGNPPPNFTWSCDNNRTTREGSVLTLDGDTFHANVNHTCQCTAMSSIFSQNVSETVIIKMAHETECCSEWANMKLYIIIGVLAAVIFVILMVLHFKGFLCCSANKDPDIVQHHEDHSKTSAADTSSESNEIPTYSEVRKPLTGPTALKTEKRMTKTAAKGITYNADQGDTVIYLDLKGGRSKVGKSPPVALPMISQTAMFNQSQYAAVDHALQPPPLKKRNN